VSGRGDKDIDYVLEHYPLVEYEPTGKENGFEVFLSHIKKH
jgi:tryptophan synthase beta chain